MRYVFRPDKIPRVVRLLLVESGSRSLIEGVIPNMVKAFGENLRFDLVTCFPGLPRGIDEQTSKVYRVADYATSESRTQLYKELRANDYQVLGMVCSAEPIMTKWKWMLAVRVPARAFMLNENGDYVWLDRKHAGTVKDFALLRAGFEGPGSVRTLIRLLLFPFTLAYLIVYAGTVHTRRSVRLLFQ